jgi:hypothetical protein
MIEIVRLNLNDLNNKYENYVSIFDPFVRRMVHNKGFLITPFAVYLEVYDVDNNANAKYLAKIFLNSMANKLIFQRYDLESK